MAYENLVVTTQGRVTTITLNRPAAMNAVTPAMHHELQAAFDAFAADDGQYIAVVTGAGERAFCAGSDLKVISDIGVAGTKYPKNGYAGLIERHDLSKPLIAAVNGVALGGGFEIALVLRSDHRQRDGEVRSPRAAGRRGGAGRRAPPARAADRSEAGDGNDPDLRAGERAPRLRARLRQRGGRAGGAAGRRGALVRQDPQGGAAVDPRVEGDGPPRPRRALRRRGDGSPGRATRPSRRWKTAEDTEEGPRAFAEKRQPRWQGT